MLIIAGNTENPKFMLIIDFTVIMQLVQELDLPIKFEPKPHHLSSSTEPLLIMCNLIDLPLNSHYTDYLHLRRWLDYY